MDRCRASRAFEISLATFRESRILATPARGQVLDFTETVAGIGRAYQVGVMNRNDSTPSKKTDARSSAGLRIRTSIKAGPGFGAGGLLLNHGVRVRTSVKAGTGWGYGTSTVRLNHGVRVRTSVKAGAD